MLINELILIKHPSNTDSIIDKVYHKKYVEFDTRKANLNLIPEDVNSVQSSLYTVRQKHSTLLSSVVVHRLGYNSDTFKGAD